MKNNEKFREFTHNLLWFLCLFQILSPLFLHAFHNKINKYIHKNNHVSRGAPRRTQLLPLFLNNWWEGQSSLLYTIPRPFSLVWSGKSWKCVIEGLYFYYDLTLLYLAEFYILELWLGILGVLSLAIFWYSVANPSELFDTLA